MAKITILRNMDQSFISLIIKSFRKKVLGYVKIGLREPLNRIIWAEARRLQSRDTIMWTTMTGPSKDQVKLCIILLIFFDFNNYVSSNYYIKSII